MVKSLLLNFLHMKFNINMKYSSNSRGRTVDEMLNFYALVPVLRPRHFIHQDKVNFFFEVILDFKRLS